MTLFRLGAGASHVQTVRRLFPSNTTKIQLNAFFRNFLRCSALKKYFRAFASAFEGEERGKG